MIFVTVGTELPFDRMVNIVDRWASDRGRSDVFAQIGEKGTPPKNIDYASFLEPDEFKAKFEEASCIIAHAGMGTILTSLNYGKRLLVMPRKASLGEHRNEHQLATANHLLKLGKVTVSFNEEELYTKLDNLESITNSNKIGKYANEDLLTNLSEFIAKS